MLTDNNRNFEKNKKRLIIASIIILIFFYFFIFSTDETYTNKKNVIKERAAAGKHQVKNGRNQKGDWNDSLLVKNIKSNMKLYNENIENDLFKVTWHDEIRPDNGRVRKFRINKNAEYPVDYDKLYEHPEIAIITSDKPNYLDRLLSNLINNCNANPMKISIFNDGTSSLNTILLKYDIPTEKEYRLSNYNKIESPEDDKGSEVKIISNEEKQFYMNAHYRQIFKFIFKNESYENAIFLEDDLIMSPDSLEYFNHFSKLMKYDPSIFGISAWNDNGFKWNIEQSRNMVENKLSFLRQDHFGGLGFLISKDIFLNRIEPNWQEESSIPWDVIVQKSMRLGDSCIYPEIPRSHHAPLLERTYESIYKDGIEKDGWSNYNFYLPKITTVHTYNLNLSKYLTHEYDKELKQKLRKATEIDSLYTVPLLWSGLNKYVFYVPSKGNDDPKWDIVINKLQMVGRGNGGAVRGIYKGVIETTYFGKRIYLVGTYSPLYSQQHRNKNPRILFNDFEKNQFDASIKDPLTMTMLYRTDKDLSLDITLAEKGYSCKEFCEKHKLTCSEADMMILTSPAIIELQLEHHCPRVLVVPNGSTADNYFPVKNQETGMCYTSKEYIKLSCTSKPPKKSDFSRVCICKDKSFN